MPTSPHLRFRCRRARIVLALALCSAAFGVGPLTFSHTAAASGWAVIASPNGINSVNNELQDVTCLSASDCWAVGSFVADKVQQTLIQRWDGKSWSVVPSPNTSATEANTLNSVTCSSASDCWAVGFRAGSAGAVTLIQRWNGSSWSIVASPNNGPKTNVLTGVTCNASNDCWAVGFYTFDDAVLRERFGTLIQRWNGTAWSIVPSPDYQNPNNPASVTGLSILRSVTCTSASDCWAVGWGKAVLEPATTLTLRWNGTAWSMVPSPAMGTSQSYLASVTCTSSSDCWAVGDYTDSDEEFSQTLIERWNGQEWSIVPSPNVSRGNSLTGVSCTSAANCWAVGSHATDTRSTLIQNWNGSAWRTVPSADVAGKERNALQSVTCTSAADCWAVGLSGGLPVEGSQTLIQRYTLTDATAPAQLLNISTRAQVQQGDNVMIGGFIITGGDQKNVLLRAIGPSLSGSGVQGALQNPTLELFQGDTLLASNDDWKQTQRSEIEATGIPPTNDAESAIVRRLGAGSYTAVVRGANNAAGVALVEAYDLEQAVNAQLANISTRAFVQTDDKVLIGGVIVGPANTSSSVLVRAIGPSLGASGVSNALPDPALELFDGNGVSVAVNDNWRETQQSEIAATGVPPTDDRESAILQSLRAGNYTAIVRGKDGASGVALVEAFNLR